MARLDSASRAEADGMASPILDGQTLNMWTVYILKSLAQRKFYTGHTDNLVRRLNEHNSGKNYYSKRFKFWSVIHIEKYKLLNEAVAREKYFKSAAGRRWLKKNIGL